MRLVAILVVLAAVGWLSAKQFHHTGTNVTAGEKVVNDARGDLAKAQADQSRYYPQPDSDQP